jgi:hypothetical protein
MGYDPDTGQVLDAERYREWQRRQREVKTEAPAEAEGMSIYELFRKASTALQNWIDDDAARPLVCVGALDRIKQEPEVLQIVRTYESCGPEVVAKLWARLEFLVDNRKKFYASRA